MRAGSRLALALTLATAVSGFAAQAASATFHEIVVRELYPGTVASPESEYVELQMYASGQQFVAGHAVSFYNPAGGQVGSAKFGADVASGANQATILVATPAAEAEFGVAADLSMPPAVLDPSGGAVCWEAYDCVSWGGFAGSVKPSPGAPAAPGGIPDGQALRRTIAPGCASLLEAADDHGNSAADLEAVFPAPRPNSVAPTERPCSGGGGGGGSGGQGSGGGQGSDAAPQTRLRRHPAKRTGDRTPTFRFTSSARGARFQCKVDRRRYRPCSSPFTPKPLAFGRHSFRVRSRSGSGPVDPTPATFSFRVIGRR